MTIPIPAYIQYLLAERIQLIHSDSTESTDCTVKKIVLNSTKIVLNSTKIVLNSTKYKYIGWDLFSRDNRLEYYSCSTLYPE
jgi:hypothetical protein